jgi:CDGSH-type Zn-finger protein/uncharacterized Fe-S cluster protein YjdI
MKSKLLEYKGDQITVTYDLARCIHAATCVKRLPAVFDVNKKPWIQPDNASADDVAAVVERCPSGALHSSRAEAPPTESKVRIAADGPIYVDAKAKLKTLAGEVLLEDTRLALCRCGQSKNKPLCDNAHIDAKFADPGSLGSPAGDGQDAEIEGELVIAAAPNGPLLLDGGCEIRGADGAVHRSKKAALCRCGLSSNKPYCDGSHATGGFKAD